MSNRIKSAIGISALALGTIAPVVLAAAPAGANPVSGTVVMSGYAKCGGNLWNPRASWMWVKASDGEQGWAYLSHGNWSFTLTKVPSWGTWVSWSWGCQNGAQKSYGRNVNRPLVGYGAGFGTFY